MWPSHLHLICLSCYREVFSDSSLLPVLGYFILQASPVHTIQEHLSSEFSDPHPKHEQIFCEYKLQNVKTGETIGEFLQGGGFEVTPATQGESEKGRGW